MKLVQRIVYEIELKTNLHIFMNYPSPNFVYYYMVYWGECPIYRGKVRGTLGYYFDEGLRHLRGYHAVTDLLRCKEVQLHSSSLEKPLQPVADLQRRKEVQMHLPSPEKTMELLDLPLCSLAF